MQLYLYVNAAVLLHLMMLTQTHRFAVEVTPRIFMVVSNLAPVSLAFSSIITYCLCFLTKMQPVVQDYFMYL
jgi:hypothetical protein